MTAAPQDIYGADTPDPEPTVLRMGAVSLLFEPHSGWMRTVKLNGGQEILWAIYIAVRDHNWNTIPAEISNLEIKQKHGGFQIRYHADCRQDAIHFAYDAELIGTPDGKLTYSMRGEALTSFLKNRVGFCVLHPAECAGKAVTVEHTQVEPTRGKFPDGISPHQPFFDIRALTQEIMWRVKATVRFKGDVFEMEDQRNWTDASFKTYSTPLALPYPVKIEAGTVIKQSVTLELTGFLPDRADTDRSSSPVALRQTSSTTQSLTDFGIGFAPLASPLTELEADRIRTLNPTYLRVDIDFAAPDWRETFLQQYEALKRVRLDTVPLEVALTLTQNSQEELNALAAMLRVLPRRTVTRWFIFQQGAVVTPPEVLDQARAVLEPFQHRAAFFAGTTAYFTELNRNRPNDGRHFCYSLNPQVHAFDTRSLMETLPIQYDTVRNAKRLGKMPAIAVSPVTLKPRRNPNATSAESPPTADPRQYALCGAAWTVGSLASLTHAGAYSATYYELFGDWGVMEREADGGKVSPIYHVLADVGEFGAGRFHVYDAFSRSDTFAQIMLSKRGRLRMLLANLSASAQEVEVEFPARSVTLKLLDATTLNFAMTEPEAYRADTGQKLRGKSAEDGRGQSTKRIRLTLSPYAIARLDGEEIG